MAYAVTTADIEARWRRLTPVEAPIAQQLLQDATVKLDAARPGLAAAVAAGTVDPELVEIALVDAVKAVLRNPDALAGTTIGADGTLSINYGSAGPGNLGGRIAFVDTDLASIDAALAAGGGTVGGAFTIGLSARPFFSRPSR